MVVMFPKIAGIRVDSWWGVGRQNRVRCVARLTRPLTTRETARLRELLPVDELEGDSMTWFCRPEEVEPWEERAALALSLSTRPPARRRRLRLASGGAAVRRPG